MSAAYTPLPTQADPNGHHYPPPRTKALLARLVPTSGPPPRLRRLLLLVTVLALSSTLLVYLVFASSFSSLAPLRDAYNYYGSGGASGGAGGPGNGGGAWSDAGDPRSPFFRDPHPALHARLFLGRAQAEIRRAKLDTCAGQLSAPMVDAYLAAATPYCTPRNDDSNNTDVSSATCFPAHAGPGTPNQWWPYAQAFCASRNLAHTHGWGGDFPARGSFTGRCTVTPAGARLKIDMGREGFLGAEFRVEEEEEEGEGRACGETIDHPVLFVPRQDRWNPFHVGEDLVTTFLALTLFSRHISPPSSTTWTALSHSFGTGARADAGLAGQLEAELVGAAGLQLVFLDDHLPTASLFAPLYDRIGAFVPRRTAAEALGEGAPTCFRTAFHSVGAGASLLSATHVGRPYGCASELVWGAALWLRWVWGLEGGAVAFDSSVYSEYGAARNARRGEAEWDGEGRGGEVGVGVDVDVEKREWAPRAEPVQVLFLSREKFDAFTRHKNANHKLSQWQEARHIANEGALLAGLRAGLAGLCRVGTIGGGGTPPAGGVGAHECTYTDADAFPDAWGVRMHPREARALGLEAARGGATSGHAPGEAAHDTHESTHDSAQGNTTHAARAPLPRGAARALRFATLDPTTSALATQLGAVGRADVVVSVHAGALGLTLFMPPGRASVVELVTVGSSGNYHFHNMAHMLGMQYVRVDVAKTVDVPAVVEAVRKVVEARLG
ncbi:hypothetical protein B0H17DRAFT_456702 [Mycena rosella]|uniref:Uncharacterized protein n=1 Tax=Mycena rosella TaxID=1033263 RepID=A0AAD7GH83_MYCRO|nr:hypothetical protein B0H17DRAFT_456702 [Mycena rosella]